MDEPTARVPPQGTADHRKAPFPGYHGGLLLGRALRLARTAGLAVGMFAERPCGQQPGLDAPSAWPPRAVVTGQIWSGA